MRRKCNIEFFRSFANEKNGICLSDSYTNCHNKLKFKCEFGHIWETTASNALRNNWCPICGGSQRLTINDMQILAKNKNGKCLSLTYINSGSKLLWECSNGHIWSAVPESIRSGCWCPICANKNIPLSIDMMQEIAKSRKGVCLSESYINSHTKLYWRCEHGHTWFASPTNIKSGKWCPKCKRSVGEEQIEKYFVDNCIEYVREKSFDNCIGSKKLRFDFYLPGYNILIEYDGHQHFKPVAFGGCSVEKANKTFLKTVKNDEIKNKYCADNSITLIRIPYTINNIEEYLKNNLNRYCVNV